MLFEFHAALAQIFAQMTDVDGLPAVLRTGDRRDDLRDHRAGDLKALGALDQFSVHHRAVVQHVPDVDETAVKDGLHEIIGVMEMQDALVVRLGDLLGQQDAAGQVLGDFARDEVALRSRRERVFIGVLLHHVFVGVGDEAEDRLVRRVRLADERTVVAIENIRLRERIMALHHQPLFDDVLDVLDEHPLFLLPLDVREDVLDLLHGGALGRFHLRVRLSDRDRDLCPVIIDDCAVSLDNLHCSSL